MFRGHPTSRLNLEQDLEDLLAGKEIIVAPEEKKGDEKNYK